MSTNNDDLGRVHRQAYRPPAWHVDHVDLCFSLEPTGTRVRATLTLRQSSFAALESLPLILQGEQLDTQSLSINGTSLPADQWPLNEQGELVIEGLSERAEIVSEVIIHPASNRSLEGLYAAGDLLLTQCEAEGFRRITWYPDRPDVMATFKVRLEADRERFPVLLSNGNCTARGDLPDGRHYTEWEDPFPKPSYLFAIAAGPLTALEDEFVTKSGRRVRLFIWSEPHDLSQLRHAMNSLIRAMTWDEVRFGLEYDLDVYHIVVTHHFNMGAMENKSLNIFNSRYVLASPETASDEDFEAVESVIAHEYFHNWTGNRVTCRDWFQLTLKEGLTVFRDQEFTSDLHSRALKRVNDVAGLMARQFAEDASPLAHPIRPQSYKEINNFYTATIYQKGAEVIRMLHTLLGEAGFIRGVSHYLAQHDGQAATCDDFISAMAEANNTDLSQFMRWYDQIGTPTIYAGIHQDTHQNEWVMTFRQQLPMHPGNADLGPLPIPIEVGFLDEDNRQLPVTLANEEQPGPPSRVLVLDQASMSVRFKGLGRRPLPSLLRGLSAPVKLEFDWSLEDLARLAGHDVDAVSRWLAGRRLGEEAVIRRVNQLDDAEHAATQLASAWQQILSDTTLDPAMAAKMLNLPAEAELAERFERAKILDIHHQRQQLQAEIKAILHPRLWARYETLGHPQPWSDSAQAVGLRALANTLLSRLFDGCPGSSVDEPLEARVLGQYHNADNMTDRLAALRMLVHAGSRHASELLEHFQGRFRDQPLVIDKWLMVQATHPQEIAVERIRALLGHPLFSLDNPNKVRALVGTMAVHNCAAFHRADGQGHGLLGEVVAEVDRFNPQLAARLVTPLCRWRRFADPQAGSMRQVLAAMADQATLSRDLAEVVDAALA